MSEVLIVMRREFLERVRSKAFVIGTLLFPVFMGAMWVLPVLLGRGGGGEKTVVVVDEAPAGIGDYVVRKLEGNARGEGAKGVHYRVERVAGPFERVRADLMRRVQAEEIDGYLHLPANIVEGSAVTFRARNISNFDVLDDLGDAASEAVQGERLRRAGLQAADVAALIRPVRVQTARVTDKGEESGSAGAAFILAYVFGFLTYMMIILYGVNVQRSVLEEKTNRIAEVIVSSMHARHLMLGKIVGVAAVALLQVAVWVVLITLLVTQSDVLARRFGLPPGVLDAAKIKPGVAAAVIACFVLGFLLYSAVFAAVGAAVNSDQEAQQFQIYVLAPLIVPLVFIFKIISDPLGQTATLLTLIPFTAPVALPMRLGAAEVPVWQVLAALAGMAAAVLLVAWVAGKVYRVGILSTGKKPTLKELGRWLKAA
ncbi:MAG TPA: ABC transporter permease [Longimicrobium sp.]